MLTVAVRFRPKYIEDEDEKKINHDGDIDTTPIDVFEQPQNFIRINNEFNLYFDHVLGFKSFQDDIFRKAIRSKANDFLNGNNCCILTYGAKSAGKSYTMFGKLENKNAVSHLGILPRTISYIIEKLQSFYKENCTENAMDWNLFISFGNIYNDNITDLIDVRNQKNIHLKKNKKTSEFYIKNLTQIKIKKISSFLKNMHLAYHNRKLYFSQNQKQGINIMNRCHFFAIIKLNLYTYPTAVAINKEKTKISSSILNFIDCASYPQINYKPLSENDSIDYQNLNFSFIQLNALMTRIAKKNDLTIDMRESVLTKLLYPIRRNHKHNNNKNNKNNTDECGKLLVMINCTLSPYLRAETMATLRFGNLPTVDPFILGMMEKQRHKIKRLEARSKELKVKIKMQKKQLKMNRNQNKDKMDSMEVDRYKRKIQQLNKTLERLTISNDELMVKNNEYFVYQNKFESVQSDYELLKLDYASVKKELNTQKNHNFWLMEDYNDLKLKYESVCNGNDVKLRNSNNQMENNLNKSNDQIGNLLKELRCLREEKRENELLLRAADNKLSEYESEMEAYENEMKLTFNKHRHELNELMLSIKERDEQINDIRKELEINNNNNNNNNTNVNDLFTADNIYDENINNNKNPQYIIRKLKMEIIKYKTDINSLPHVSKLRNKKHKLEEKVIHLRTEKAKQLVKFNQQRHKMEKEISTLQIHINNMSAIGKWRNLVHKRRIISISKDIQRANRKMKENYSKNSEFRDQMYLLRKIAEQKFDLALKHKMNKQNKKINGHYTPSPSMKSCDMNYRKNSELSMIKLEPYASMNRQHSAEEVNAINARLAIETTADFEKEMVGLLPNNLKRIHGVIDQLTNKLMIKNGQLHELRIKYDALNKKYIELQYDNKSDKQSSDSSSANEHLKKENNNIHINIKNDNVHAITNSSFGEYLPSILDKLANDTHTNHGHTEFNKLANIPSINSDNSNNKLIHARTYSSHHSNETDALYEIEEEDDEENGNGNIMVLYDDDELIINNVNQNNNNNAKNEENYLKLTKTITYSQSNSEATKTYTNHREFENVKETNTNNTNNNSSVNSALKPSNPKQFTFRARAHTTNNLISNHKNQNGYFDEKDKNNHNMNKHHKNESSITEYEIEKKQRQKQLRLLQESLSITFHIDNRKNTRIKLNVSMSPHDVFNNLLCDGLINNYNKKKKFTLIIQHNVNNERIIIPHQNAGMSFWELIVEFGILNLLHFNICLEENIEKYFDSCHTNNSNYESHSEYNSKIKLNKRNSKKTTDHKRGSGIWNMFAKK